MGIAPATNSAVQEPSVVTTLLFTDIEGSTRLWELEPERMRPALALHDALTRAAVEDNRGAVVKMTGDGVHAAFDDPQDAITAALQLQQALAESEATGGIPLRVRCGVHLGAVEHRDNDYFGSMVNRAARIMSAAHGGQVLLSQAVAALIGDRLPAGVALRDLGLVRLRDLANPERVFQVLHPELRQDFPALRSLEATPNNLPQQVTSFIGRERELAEVKDLLAQTRLLTLLGAGGLGKTRLSLQAAVDVVDDYPDGAWFVELAAVTDARLVPQAVASVLRVKEEAGCLVIDALVKYGRDRRWLLILDNCEHLVHACAETAVELLRAVPHLTILASSREPLHVPGETIWHLPPLAVPDVRQASTPEVLARYAAVRLFVERATAVQRSFRVTAQNAAAVAEICSRLDGIPLALELAAARVAALSVEKIATRLDDRFRLLTGGMRTALPRQQTLRALIDWSYDLLTDSERALLRRLSVFAGGWTLEAAEAVGADGAIDEACVLDLLTRLVEKSLVGVEADRERYRLLDTVRQYALERLSEAGEGDAARTRHLAFYLRLAETARPELLGPQQAVWLGRLDLERENLLAAHAWCDRADGGGVLGLRLASALRRYWVGRGLLALGQRLTGEALERDGAQDRNAARCRALFDAGQIASWAGRYAEAQRYLQQSLLLGRELGEKQFIAGALQPLALAALGQGDLDVARGHLEEALALEQEQGHERDVAGVLNGLAQIHRARGDLDAAQPLYERVLAIARDLGDREIVTVGLLNLAMVAIGRGKGDDAIRMLLEVEAIADELGWKPAGQSMLDVCTGLAAWRAEWAQAARFFGAAEAQVGETGIRRDPADEAFHAPLVATARAGLGERNFQAAAAQGRGLTYEAAMAEARSWLATRPTG
jgi:predicted ATPase/class 3 adenylate cyclase